ncbi:hypothetical protein E2R60_26450 [Paenibacillus dendritiformis]|uniref:hypothetical protein n=1 Tax=Paenibacillus dendritiformis TaxID=130049 RepID=UPI00105A12A0|nr:hypothetical protein [Paenibacillus dendritiformis]TDL48443.1 hypothetical protein E2R60_26450 [Paenibacillus dendritiformis]
MDKIIIEPGHAVGMIKLEMTKDEVNQCIQMYMQRYEDEQERCFERFIFPEYDENQKLIAVQVLRDLMEFANFICYGIDVFNTKAEKLIEIIDKMTPYLRTSEPDLGSIFDFTEGGLSFYRSSVFTEKEMEEEWFTVKSPEEQEDDLKYLYFETVMVCGLDYYDLLRKAREGTLLE